MPLSPLDQLYLNTAAGFLQIGEPQDAWNELEMITPLNRAQTEVLGVRLAVCRALTMWELAEDFALRHRAAADSVRLSEVTKQL